MRENLLERNKVLRDYKKAVMLDYINMAKPKDFSFMPLYFKDELKLSDPQRAAKKLLKSGYLTFDADANICLTNKARAFMSKRKDYVAFFQFAAPYVTIEEYITEKKYTEGIGFSCRMLKLLKEKLQYFRDLEEAEAVRKICEDLAILYLQMDCREEALSMYMTILYYQVCGLEYYSAFLKYIDKVYSLKKIKSCFAGIALPEALMDNIKTLKDYYRQGSIDEIFEENKIHINLCTKEQFKNLTECIMNDQYDSIYWNKVFGESFNKMIEVADEY